VLVCSLGDLLLDVVVRLDRPFALDTDTYGHTRVGAGGQAANVAAWAVELGARGRVVAARAHDAAGRLVADELTGRGVELVGPELDIGTGTGVSVATPDGRRTMLTDRGVAPALDANGVDGAWVAGCDWLHVSGYALSGPPLADAALALASHAPRVSVDIASAAMLEGLGAGPFRARLAALRPMLVFATEVEHALAGPLDAETVVIKLGSEGCVVLRGDRAERHPAPPAEVVDTTGAGDAFAAGFLVGGVDVALSAAARAVAQLGAMP
jgi:sugar/nucleoside kinase (ribokinase family)